MIRSFTGLLVMAVVALTGCNQNQGTPGGAGASNPAAKKPLFGQADDTFNLSTATASVQQGGTKEGSIGIKRGTNFGEDVTVQFDDVPKGVILDPTSLVIKHGDTEGKFTLTAGDEAPLGDFVVKVTGHSAKGADASNEFKLTVTKKDSFTLSVPASTSLQQGETKIVSIGIQRDKKFDQDVTLKFTDLPQGVTLDPASPVIKSGDQETKLTLKGAGDSALGNFALQVTGHPTKGSDTSSELKLTVSKK
jgi:hypothetical protein